MSFFDMEFVKKLFISSGDEMFLVDLDGNILLKNSVAGLMYPKISNLNKISHLFNFEICILKSDDIIIYTPVFAAINSKEDFFAPVIKQVKDNTFINYSLSSYSLDDKKIIVLRNDTSLEYTAKYEDMELKINSLEEKVANGIELKSKLENHLLRTNLINLLSDKVREYIDTKKIIKITLEQLKKTLDISKAEFSKNKFSKEIKIYSEIDNEKLISKLFVPIYKGKNIYGYIILYRKNIQNIWQKEEIDLLKNVSVLLATSFSKEELYIELDNQKKELECALKQLKDAQLQIVQTEKMASLGKLVAGVAHEINTPLGAINSNLNLLEKYLSKDKSLDEIKGFVNDISVVNQEAIRRIDSMVKSLKNFVRLDEAKKKKVDLIDGLNSTLALISHEIKGKVEIEKEFEKIPMVYCYPDYINQVFMNIILNACQSITNNGVVKISVKQLSNNVVVEISDNGSGISKENLKKIFDFGFTTKKIGQGTGLGLALSKKIIDEHNGKIEVESTIGKGTTFKIFLPIN